MANKMRKISDQEFSDAYNNLDIKKVISSISRKYKNKIDTGDRESACNIALYRTLSYFKPEFKQKFTSSLVRFLYFELNRELKKKNKKRISISDCDISSFSDLFCYKEKFNYDLYKDVLEIMNCYIDEEMKNVLIDKFINKKNLNDISKEYNIHKKQLSFKIKEALNTIKEKYYE